MTGNAVSETSGFSARVCKNGAYGFASSAVYTPESVAASVAAAAENAAFLDQREKLGKVPFAKVPSFREELRYTREDDVTQKQIIDHMNELDALVAKLCPKLKSRFTAARCLTMEKLLYTSDGVFAHTATPRSIIYVGLTAEGNDGAPVEIFEPFGTFGVFDEVFTNPVQYESLIAELYEQVMAKAGGVYAEPGRKQVILHPDLAGILAHEAVGHTVEADFVLSGSVGGPNLNKQVASELVTMVDFAHTALGQRCPVPVYVDDEGTPGTDAVLIENGILKEFMHNKESAAHFGHTPKGNARAFAYNDEPLIRMRNTCILPGKDKLADMIASIDDGYYFIKTGNGQADATGEFMFGVNFGYEIEKGKLGRPLKDTTIAGVAFDVLKTVDMLSDDLSWSCSGMCGKKQMIPVGMGGPAIRAFVNVGGR
jgi:TldD protein